MTVADADLVPTGRKYLRGSAGELRPFCIWITSTGNCGYSIWNHVGVEVPAAGPDVIRESCRVSDAAAVREFLVDVANGVHVRIQVAEDTERVGLVGPGPVQRFGDWSCPTRRLRGCQS